MRRYTVVILAVCCIMAGNILAQDISVRAVLDTNKGLIGDQFRLRLMVEKPADSWQVTFPPVEDSLINNIEILEAGPVDTGISGSKQLLSRDLLITVFDTGFFEIPSFSFAISNASLTDTLNSLPVYIEIQAMKADSTIRDIKGIYRVPLGFREIAPYLFGAIALALLAWLAIRYFKNRPVHLIHKEEKITLEAADIIALRELARLREEKPWLNNRMKHYYSSISDILRNYIERRYRTLAMEQTTSEILASLANKDIPKDETQRLAEILRLSDLVKFAKVIPDTEKNAEIVGLAEAFVRNTKTVVVEETISENNLR